MIKYFISIYEWNKLLKSVCRKIQDQIVSTDIWKLRPQIFLQWKGGNLLYKYVI